MRSFCLRRYGMIWQLIEVGEPAVGFDMFRTQLYEHDAGVSSHVVEWLADLDGAMNLGLADGKPARCRLICPLLTTEVCDGSKRSVAAEADRLLGGPTVSDWPDPRDFVDPTWDQGERETIADYLRCGFVFRAFGGVSTCRFCGHQNGAFELSDGVWYWPDGLVHYVADHDVRLPSEFVEHALSSIWSCWATPIVTWNRGAPRAHGQARRRSRHAPDDSGPVRLNRSA